MITERRLHERKDTTLLAEVSINGVDLSGEAETNNISIGGLRLFVANDFGITPKNQDALVGRRTQIFFSNQKLTIYGDIIRADSDSGEIAVVINEITNFDLWKDMCSILKTA